jgi:hypothetical protein
LAPLASFLVSDRGGTICAEGRDGQRRALLSSGGGPTEELAEMVGNVVDKEPTQESYARIKAALLATNALTPYQMLDKFMAMEPLGGRKATELLTAMQKLRPPTDDQFFTWAFLQRLPCEVRILLAQDDHADMRKLAEKTDALLALHQPQTHDINAITAAFESHHHRRLCGPGNGHIRQRCPVCLRVLGGHVIQAWNKA